MLRHRRGAQKSVNSQRKGYGMFEKSLGPNALSFYPLQRWSSSQRSVAAPPSRLASAATASRALCISEFRLGRDRPGGRKHQRQVYLASAQDCYGHTLARAVG